MKGKGRESTCHVPLLTRPSTKGTTAMKRTMLRTLSLAALVISLAAWPALGQDVGEVAKEHFKGIEKQYSPYVGRNIPDRVLWGDTHLHTSFSPDAGLTGTTLGPEEAFRFARGEGVTSTGGLKAQLRRPHAFLVVSGPAEGP